MKILRSAVTVALGLILAVALYGWWATTPRPGRAAAHTGPAADPTQPLVDRSALDTARRLLPLAATAEEQRIAEAAVATADHLLDLAFAAALREVTEHPVALTKEGEAAQARIDAGAQRLVGDNLRIQELTAAVAKATATAASDLEAELALARAQFEVDQDEFNQASKDLIAAGGDQRARIQALVAEHSAAVPKTPAPAVTSGVKPGLVHQATGWMTLRRKVDALEAAQQQTATALATLAAQRSAVQQRIATQTEAAAAAGGASRSSAVAAGLLATTQQIGADHKRLAGIDERRAGEAELATRYDEWRTIAVEQATAALHGILLTAAVIAAVCLLLLYFDRWLRSAFDRLHIDRRQVETLRTVTTVTLQVAAVLFILLAIIGPPNQLATFLGLAGAGLTVALKDFIVAFVGWLVLMGKNGIRLGDWVEVNGVSGEVVELGMFHTVLLETGNWTDSGHPTGRRVTFTNSFAIQGHYFNFSTTGQWLWDELQLVVPPGQDLYAVVDSITRVVREATAANAKQAEEEWRRAAPSRKSAGLSAAPAINVKPVIGGTEISLRYIARANERYRLRADLYQAAVDLLGGQAHPHPPPAAISAT